MKKRYAVIMTAAMMTGVMAATALAEGPGTVKSLSFPKARRKTNVLR